MSKDDSSLLSETIILNQYFDENERPKKLPADDPIIDSRFQSYLRFYIADILNSDKSRFDSGDGPQAKNGVLKINKCFFSKVAICGIIVSIYDAPKFYR
jgi:hypothetical protein